MIVLTKKIENFALPGYPTFTGYLLKLSILNSAYLKPFPSLLSQPSESKDV